MVALAVACAIWLSGCGTVINVTKDREVFGGVRIDAECGVGDWDVWRHPSNYAQPVFPYVNLLAAACWVGVDLPLSAVGDTLTLPITFLASVGQKEKGQGAEKATPPSSAAPSADQ